MWLVRTGTMLLEEALEASAACGFDLSLTTRQAPWQDEFFRHEAVAKGVESSSLIRGRREWATKV